MERDTEREAVCKNCAIDGSSEKGFSSAALLFPQMPNYSKQNLIYD